MVTNFKYNEIIQEHTKRKATYLKYIIWQKKGISFGNDTTRITFPIFQQGPN